MIKWVIKTEEHGLNDSQTRVLAEIRNNPNITKKELAVVCHLGRTSIDNTVAVLKKRGFIERVGSILEGELNEVKGQNVLSIVLKLGRNKEVLPRLQLSLRWIVEKGLVILSMMIDC